MDADSSIFEVFCKLIAIGLGLAFVGMLAYKLSVAYGPRCPGCGKACQAGSEICPNCGRKL